MFGTLRAYLGSLPPWVHAVSRSLNAEDGALRYHSELEKASSHQQAGGLRFAGFSPGVMPGS